jgi:hypothetical protein
MVNKRMFETRSVARMEIERLVMDTLEISLWEPVCHYRDFTGKR